MAGLLGEQPKPSGGLLGAPQKAGFMDYALAALAAGGVSGAAALALKQRMGQQQYARQAPILQELTSAFAPQAAPREVQGPGVDGAPVSQSAPQARPPSYAALAPLLARAQANGINTSQFEGLLGNLGQERQANQPKVFNPGGGVLAEYDPTNRKVTPIYTAPVDPRDGVSPGWEWADPAHKTQQPIKGGPYDPDMIGKIAGIRREAVVSRPTAARPRAAAGGSSSAGLPPGYVPR